MKPSENKELTSPITESIADEDACRIAIVDVQDVRRRDERQEDVERELMIPDLRLHSVNLRKQKLQQLK